MKLENQQQIVDWLAAQEQRMIDLLRDVVNIDSYSGDKAGVDAVAEKFRWFFEEEGIRTSTIPIKEFGDVLKAEVAGRDPSRGAIILMGHRDTVFPTGEVSLRPFRVADGVAYGPGVCDMKGGLVQNAFVLAAYSRFGGAPAPITVLMTSDEEIGSAACRSIIEETAREGRAVFNAEPSRPSGNVVTGRRGGMFMKLCVCGKSAHSGANLTEGISAIEELSHKILALHALTDIEKGVTVNVGLISGGQTVNTVAPWAEAELDMRFETLAQRHDTLAQVEEIVQGSHLCGSYAELTIKGEYCPVTPDEASQALFLAYQQAASEVGLTIDGEYSKGCADSGFTANVGCPTICGVGPTGWRAHTPEEYLVLDSMVPRAQALALAIRRLGD